MPSDIFNFDDMQPYLWYHTCVYFGIIESIMTIGFYMPDAVLNVWKTALLGGTVDVYGDIEAESVGRDGKINCTQSSIDVAMHAYSQWVRDGFHPGVGTAGYFNYEGGTEMSRTEVQKMFAAFSQLLQKITPILHSLANMDSMFPMLGIWTTRFTAPLSAQGAPYAFEQIEGYDAISMLRAVLIQEMAGNRGNTPYVSQMKLWWSPGNVNQGYMRFGLQADTTTPGSIRSGVTLGRMQRGRRQTIINNVVTVWARARERMDFAGHLDEVQHLFDRVYRENLNANGGLPGGHEFNEAPTYCSCHHLIERAEVALCNAYHANFNSNVTTSNPIRPGFVYPLVRLLRPVPRAVPPPVP